MLMVLLVLLLLVAVVVLFEYVFVHSLPISFVLVLFGSDGWVLGCVVSVEIWACRCHFP